MHDDPFYSSETTVSSTECTGLIQTGIDDFETAEAYGELYPIHEQYPTDILE